ncbi:hypothetical protein [Synechococcus sp. CS-603]|uniref:hypothetical protein n=1 Tax=Synechococcus sp. CS-603 TaxID=2847981 RepID=UPI00223BBAB8|nr:hypothetical protein [Synechococcus sp. CS-603]MCT0202428.1 hypothetical protein [Synechococcus sp. CS-603]
MGRGGESGGDGLILWRILSGLTGWWELHSSIGKRVDWLAYAARLIFKFHADLSFNKSGDCGVKIMLIFTDSLNNSSRKE